MKVTIVFPKATSYYGKGLDTQRIYDSTIKKYLGILKDACCPIEYFIEDKLAVDFCNAAGFDQVNILTCISPSDISFFSNYKDLIELDDAVYTEYDKVSKQHGDYEKKMTVPITLIREDREQYIQKRVDCFRKRTKAALDDYLKRSKAVLMFRFDNGSDRASSIKDTVYQGDGRLCVEVNLNTNMVLTYYGGTYLTVDNLPTILSL